MFTSHKQISPPSLVLKLKISEVSQKWIPKAVELKRIPTHKKCKCKKFCSQTRLVGEIYSSDVIMHRGYCFRESLRVEVLREFQTKVTKLATEFGLLFNLELRFNIEISSRSWPRVIWMYLSGTSEYAAKVFRCIIVRNIMHEDGDCFKVE